MLAWTDGWKIVVFGTAIAVAPSLLSHSAQAARPRDHIAAPKASHGSPAPKREAVSVHGSGARLASSRAAPAVHYASRRGDIPVRNAMFTRMSGKYAFAKNGKSRYVARGGYGYGYGGLQCVPFARAASGIELKGNAAVWWDAAAGVYERGSRPEPGSVLNFRSTGHMRLGHVAVVTGVMNSREITIDHANWAGSYGSVSRGVAVQDVSPNNDWSEVRVALGRTGDFGSVYPTYGFIYDRPDTGMMASNGAVRRTASQSYDEVAEAPERPRVYTPTRRRR